MTAALCPRCNQPLTERDSRVWVEAEATWTDGKTWEGKVAVHEHCADAEDAEAAIAAGDYDPAEDYPHGAY